MTQKSILHELSEVEREHYRFIQSRDSEKIQLLEKRLENAATSLEKREQIQRQLLEEEAHFNSDALQYFQEDPLPLEGIASAKILKNVLHFNLIMNLKNLKRLHKKTDEQFNLIYKLEYDVKKIEEAQQQSQKDLDMLLRIYEQLRKLNESYS